MEPFIHEGIGLSLEAEDEQKRDGVHEEAVTSPPEVPEAPVLASPSKYVILPHNRYYVAWYCTVISVTLLAAVLDPYNSAFVMTAGMYPFDNFWAVTDYIATTVFVADINVNTFFLAYKDETNKCFVTNYKDIAKHYVRSSFLTDLLFSLPIEPIVVGSMGITVRNTQRAKFLALLRWLRIGRMYRIFEVFAIVQHKHLVPPIMLTLTRNYTYLFYLVHWVACVLYFVAVVKNFSYYTWLGNGEAKVRHEEEGGWTDYLYSFFFSIGVFTGYSSQVFFAQSVETAIVLCVCFILNIIAQAYILGTITVLLTKSDLETIEYRTSKANLDTYISNQRLPQSLQAAMHQHLELQFNSEKTADHNILKHHPPIIRLKVLRHLYLDILKDCYLMAGCKPQFLNQLLSAVRMEFFMPNVSICQAGDAAGELLIIVDGSVSAALPPSSHKPKQVHPNELKGQDSALSASFLEGSKLFSRGFSEDGLKANLFAEKCRSNTFVDEPKPEFSEDGTAKLSALDTPIQVGSKPSSIKLTRFGGETTGGKSLMNGSGYQGKSHIMSGNDSRGKGGLEQPESSTGKQNGGSFSGGLASGLLSFIDNHARSISLGTSQPVGEVPFFTEGNYTMSAWTTSVTHVLVISNAAFQRLSESCPKDVNQVFKNLVKGAEKRLKDEVKEAMGSGQLEPNSGQQLMLLARGDSFSSIPPAQLTRLKGMLTPLQIEAMEEVSAARTLLRENIDKHQVLRMYAYLNAASSGETQRLPELVGLGREVSATDYDVRSALMLAARENKEDAVELLLKAGHDTDTVDSFGYTALFEAVRMGNDGCIDLLLAHNAKLNVAPQIVAPCIFQAVLNKDMACLRRFIRAGADVDCTDLDGRTPLFLAAVEGMLEVVMLLVEEGNARVDAVDHWGHSPEGNAQLAGHHEVAEYLRKQAKGGTQKQPLLAQGGIPHRVQQRQHQPDEAAGPLSHQHGVPDSKVSPTDDNVSHTDNAQAVHKADIPLTDLCSPGNIHTSNIAGIPGSNHSHTDTADPVSRLDMQGASTSRPGTTEGKRQELRRAIRSGVPHAGSRLGTPMSGKRTTVMPPQVEPFLIHESMPEPLADETTPVVPYTDRGPEEAAGQVLAAPHMIRASEQATQQRMNTPRASKGAGHAPASMALPVPLLLLPGSPQQDQEQHQEHQQQQSLAAPKPPLAVPQQHETSPAAPQPPKVLHRSVTERFWAQDAPIVQPSQEQLHPSAARRPQTQQHRSAVQPPQSLHTPASKRPQTQQQTTAPQLLLSVERTAPAPAELPIPLPRKAAPEVPWAEVQKHGEQTSGLPEAEHKTVPASSVLPLTPQDRAEPLSWTEVQRYEASPVPPQPDAAMMPGGALAPPTSGNADAPSVVQQLNVSTYIEEEAGQGQRADTQGSNITQRLAARNILPIVGSPGLDTLEEVSMQDVPTPQGGGHEGVRAAPRIGSLLGAGESGLDSV